MKVNHSKDSYGRLQPGFLRKAYGWSAALGLERKYGTSMITRLLIRDSSIFESELNLTMNAHAFNQRTVTQILDMDVFADRASSKSAKNRIVTAAPTVELISDMTLAL
jgi:hypothetical protein